MDSTALDKDHFLEISKAKQTIILKPFPSSVHKNIQITEELYYISQQQSILLENQIESIQQQLDQIKMMQKQHVEIKTFTTIFKKMNKIFYIFVFFFVFLKKKFKN